MNLQLPCARRLRAQLGLRRRDGGRHACSPFPPTRRPTASATPSGLPRRRGRSDTGAPLRDGSCSASASVSMGALPSLETSAEDREKMKAALLQMMRPWNFAPSVLLVFLGAWAGTGRSLLAAALAARSATVWVMSLVSGGVAVGSCVINDFFDYASGVDIKNAPNKPLPSGVVTPDAALLLSGGVYAAVLCAACVFEPRLPRVIVALSAALTLLYTPVLKRLTGVKNLVVATIIALSPLAGALSAGAASPGLAAVLPPCIWLFLGILHRELLMDVNDVEGDAASGVRTLPVVLGRRAATIVASSIMAAATAFAVGVALSGQGLTWMVPRYGLPKPALHALGVCAVLANAAPLLLNCVRVMRTAYDRTVVSHAIDNSMKHIGLGLLLLAVLA